MAVNRSRKKKPTVSKNPVVQASREQARGQAASAKISSTDQIRKRNERTAQAAKKTGIAQLNTDLRTGKIKTQEELNKRKLAITNPEKVQPFVEANQKTISSSAAGENQLTPIENNQEVEKNPEGLVKGVLGNVKKAFGEMREGNFPPGADVGMMIPGGSGIANKALKEGSKLIGKKAVKEAVVDGLKPTNANIMRKLEEMSTAGDDILHSPKIQEIAGGKINKNLVRFTEDAQGNVKYRTFSVQNTKNQGRLLKFLKKISPKTYAGRLITGILMTQSIGGAGIGIWAQGEAAEQLSFQYEAILKNAEFSQDPKDIALLGEVQEAISTLSNPHLLEYFIPFYNFKPILTKLGELAKANSFRDKRFEVLLTKMEEKAALGIEDDERGTSLTSQRLG